MRDFFKYFFNNIAKMFKYMGLSIIDPVRAFNELINERYQVFIGIMTFAFSGILFGPVLWIAAKEIRPTGWLPIIVKEIPEEMLYVYFRTTAMFIPILLLLAAIPIVEIAGMFIRSKSTTYGFKETFSTGMLALNMVVLFDFFTEAFAIAYFLICKAMGLPQVFPQWLLLTMFFTYGMMLLWTIMLVSIQTQILKNASKLNGFITGVVTTLVYWFYMGIWIA